TGTAMSSKMETGRAGPRSRISRPSISRRQPSTRSQSARREKVAGAPASNPVRLALSIATRTRSNACPELKPSNSSTRTDPAEALRVSGQPDRAAGEEVARGGRSLGSQQLGSERRGMRDPEERQEEHRLAAGQRHRAEHRLCHNGQRALRARDQATQMDAPF